MTVRIHNVEVSNPRKIWFPGSGIRKIDIIEYYEFIAPYILPHLQGRPITMHRFPEGINESNFWQKSAPKYFPDYIERVEVDEDEGTKIYSLINNPESLIYIANTASIPLHTWQSRTTKLEYPDQIIWDLDPSDDDFDKVRLGAKLMKAVLEELGLQPFLKTTGSKGLHLQVSIKPQYDFDIVKQFSKSVAEFASKEIPQLFTTEIRKNKRGNRVFVDYLRNQYGHTAVSLYSVRPIEGAPVAAPIYWEEIDELNPQSFNIKNIEKRISAEGDIWKDFYKKPQSITRAIKKLETLYEPLPLKLKRA